MKKIITYPHDGQKRVVRKFLWRSMELKNRDGEYEQRWLEFASWNEKYHVSSVWIFNSHWVKQGWAY